MQFSGFNSITNGKWIAHAYDGMVLDLVYDTRKIRQPSSSVFFAIKGAQQDGHQYIAAAYKAGVRMFVVQQPVTLEGASILQVENVVQALQQVAAAHRNKFSFPVLAITGSNGKTIVKEWISQLLGKDQVVVKSPKSYNSQIGVPLSVWQMNESHTIGVFEAGISKPGEMQSLEKIIQPSLGMITNIGSAHDEGFSGREEKVIEKIKLFENVQTVFYCRDHELIDKQLQSHKGKFTWSLKQNADVQVLRLEKRNRNTDLFLVFDGKEFTLDVPFTDDASLENILHCIVVMLYLCTDLEDLQQRLRTLQPVAMRMELKEGVNHCYLIDDSYNNDLAGFALALEFLMQQKHRADKSIILSDVLESGMEADELYARIAAMLKNTGIKKLIGIGPVISSHKKLFDLPSEFYSSTEEFLSGVQTQKFSDEVILVKGARIFGFEKIIQRLQQKVHGTVLQINLDSLSHNLSYYRNRLTPGTKMMVMVKALAYGSGSFEVANLLQYHRVDYLAVAYTDEGVALRENGISIPVMVMNPSPDTFEKIVQYRLEPEIYSFRILNELIAFLKQSKSEVTIHLKFDTGMKRLGFEPESVTQLISLLKQHPEIKIASVFTHMAGADEAIHDAFSKQQIQKFTQVTSEVERALGYRVLKHALNSAGIVRFPEYHFDMVRLGIGLYGVEANGMYQQDLAVVGTLKTIISQIKEVESTESIGYGRKGKITRKSRIATIAIGYADGYSRHFSNGVGKVYAGSKLCSIVGNVCMDMCMVDVTDTNAQEGDEVIVFGNKPTIHELAQAIGTIPYEILTGVSERVKRVFYTE